MPISSKQKQIMAFPYSKYDAIICDGAIRSGKTVFMMLSFVDDAMRRYNNQRFGICGKTVDSTVKNIIEPYMGLVWAREKYREAMENAQTDETKAAFEAKYQKKAALLQEQNKAYNQYCEDTGLKKQSDRVTIAKWDRSQAAKATAAARKYNEGFSEKTSSKVFTNQNLPDIMNTRAGDEKMTINSIEKPIEQKHTGKGNPNAILHFDVELTKRQAAILDNLPDYNSRTVVTKSNVNMADLSALTAKTGDEFALFTKSGERLIVRGNPYMVDITPEEAHRMGLDGYIWSGHTHPGVDFNALQPSTGDYAILNQFRQESSAIYNSTGQYLIFERTEPYV